MRRVRRRRSRSGESHLARTPPVQNPTVPFRWPPGTTITGRHGNEGSRRPRGRSVEVAGHGIGRTNPFLDHPYYFDNPRCVTHPGAHLVTGGHRRGGLCRPVIDPHVPTSTRSGGVRTGLRQPDRPQPPVHTGRLHSIHHGLSTGHESRERIAMRINLTSVLVDDQDKALRFYTEVLGFKQKHDVPMGEHRWITVVSPEDPDGTEIVLEPDEHPAAKPFKEALVADGIPFTSFAVDDVRGGVRAAARARRALHPGAHGDGAGDHGSARRHLRQPDPDRPPGRLAAVLRRRQPGYRRSITSKSLRLNVLSKNGCERG